MLRRSQSEESSITVSERETRQVFTAVTTAGKKIIDAQAVMRGGAEYCKSIPGNWTNHRTRSRADIKTKPN